MTVTQYSNIFYLSIRITDVTALGKCPVLHTLYLSYTQVKDISMLDSTKVTIYK